MDFLDRLTFAEKLNLIVALGVFLVSIFFSTAQTLAGVQALGAPVQAKWRRVLRTWARHIPAVAILLMPIWLPRLIRLPQWASFAVYGVAGILLVRILYPTVRKPKPISAEKLLIRVDHITGRTQDVEDFFGDVRLSRLVFLVGDAGVGKTWFAEKIVQPEAWKGGEFLPLYVNLRVDDWEDAPLDLLSRELTKAANREQIDSTAAPSEVVLLQQLQAKTGRRPLLICDQFDDYSHLHRAKFQTRNGKTMNDPAQLVAVNGFWRLIEELLRKKLACVVIVTHNRFTELKPVEFLRPETFILRGIDATAAGRTMLRVLVEASESVAATGDSSGADAGESSGRKILEALVDDMLADLTLRHEHQILPVEMKVALTSLRALPELTREAYRASGRLTGVERRWLQFEIDKASGQQLPSADLTKCLLQLVDTGNMLLSKTAKEMAESALLGGSATVSPQQLQALTRSLEMLEKAGILKFRAEGRQNLWELDHEYLIEAVRRLDEQQSGLAVILDRQSRELARATDKKDIRRALLDLSELWQVAKAELRGARLLSVYRPLILKSIQANVLSVTALLTLTVIAMFTYAFFQINKEKSASQTFAYISALLGPDPGRQSNVLWLLSTQPKETQEKVLTGLLSGFDEARVLSVLPRVVRAIRALDYGNQSVTGPAARQSCYAAPYGSSSHFQLCVQFLMLARLKDADALRFLGRFMASEDVVMAGRAVDLMGFADDPAHDGLLQSIFEPKVKELLGGDFKRFTDLQAVNVSAIVLGRIARTPEGRSRLMSQILASRHVHRPDGALALLAVLETISAEVEDAAGQEVIAKALSQMTGVANGYKSPWLQLSANPNLWKRVPPAKRAGLAERVDRLIPESYQGPARQLIASLPLEPTDTAGEKYVRQVVAGCERDLTRGVHSDCHMRLAAAYRYKGSVSQETSAAAYHLANRMVSTPGYDISDEPVHLLRVISADAKVPRSSSLAVLARLLTPAHLRDLAQVVLRAVSLSEKSDPPQIARVARIGGFAVVSDPSNSSAMPAYCGVIDRTLAATSAPQARQSLVVDFAECLLAGSASSNAFETSLSLHFEKQKELVEGLLGNPRGNTAVKLQADLAGLMNGYVVLSSQLPEARASTEFRAMRTFVLRKLVGGGCELLVGFGAAKPLAEFLEPLRWPTCTDAVTNMASVALSRRYGEPSLGVHENDGMYKVNGYALGDWAKARGEKVGPVFPLPVEVADRVIKSLAPPPPPAATPPGKNGTANP
jgi:hypothetical protein